MNLPIFLRLIRWPNVLMTIATQLILCFGFLDLIGIATALDIWQVSILAIATGLLTASGNVINDVFDVTIDGKALSPYQSCFQLLPYR